MCLHCTGIVDRKFLTQNMQDSQEYGKPRKVRELNLKPGKTWEAWKNRGIFVCLWNFSIRIVLFQKTQGILKYLVLKTWKSRGIFAKGILRTLICL